ncbi:hypothetical protein D9M68_1000810 [compost metagenome]
MPATGTTAIPIMVIATMTGIAIIEATIGAITAGTIGAAIIATAAIIAAGAAERRA